MERDFKVGDTVIRNGRGTHTIMKEGAKCRVISIIDDTFIVVGRFSEKEENGFQYEQRLMPRSFFDLSARNYYNTSKHGKNYKRKVAQ